MGIIFLLLRCLCGDIESFEFLRRIKRSFNRRCTRIRSKKNLFAYKLVLNDEEIHECEEFNPRHLTSSARFARGPPAELTTFAPSTMMVLGVFLIVPWAMLVQLVDNTLLKA